MTEAAREKGKQVDGGLGVGDQTAMFAIGEAVVQRGGCVSAAGFFDVDPGQAAASIREGGEHQAGAGTFVVQVVARPQPDQSVGDGQPKEYRCEFIIVNEIENFGDHSQKSDAEVDGDKAFLPARRRTFCLGSKEGAHGIKGHG